MTAPGAGSRSASAESTMPSKPTLSRIATLERLAGRQALRLEFAKGAGHAGQR